MVVTLPPDGVGGFQPTVELGAGPAEILVAAALIYTFALAYLLDAARLGPVHGAAMRQLLTATALPLLLAFGAVVLYTSLTVI